MDLSQIGNGKQEDGGSKGKWDGMRNEHVFMHQVHTRNVMCDFSNFNCSLLTLSLGTYC